MKIAHITDLHLGAHSNDAWRRLTEELLKINPELFIFTGDFTEKNEEIHFQRFLDWIRDEISISDSSAPFGLGLGENYFDRVILVPGNHDYFDHAITFSEGTLGFIGEHSFFSDVFPTSKLPNWTFFESKNNESVFIAQIESNKKLGSVAVGLVNNADLSHMQDWCEMGRHGHLKKNDLFLGISSIKDQKSAIKCFKKSIKILLCTTIFSCPMRVASNGEWDWRTLGMYWCVRRSTTSTLFSVGTTTMTMSNHLII